MSIVRATKVPELCGTTELPGDPIANVWNFSIHLYESTFPFPEMSEAYFVRGASASVTFPLSEADLLVSEVEAGRVKFYGMESAFDYEFGNTVYTSDIDASPLVSTVRRADVTSTDDIYCDSITAEIPHFSAYTLRISDAGDGEDNGKGNGCSAAFPGVPGPHGLPGDLLLLTVLGSGLFAAGRRRRQTGGEQGCAGGGVAADLGGNWGLVSGARR